MGHKRLLMGCKVLVVQAGILDRQSFKKEKKNERKKEEKKGEKLLSPDLVFSFSYATVFYEPHLS